MLRSWMALLTCTEPGDLINYNRSPNMQGLPLSSVPLPLSSAHVFET